MGKKQTAVEWLQHNMPDIYLIIPVRLALEFHAKFQQALQMEREQHKETWFDSTSQFANDARMDNKIDFETYYTQTFKP
jgi:hypothetical protein